MFHMSIRALALLTLAVCLPDTARGESKERVVCYYTNWSIYRPGTAKFSPQNINPYLCTHLIYAFGGFTKENSLKPFDKYQDIEKGGYAKFTGLKTYNKNLKTMLAIGGWNEGSSRFSPMVASPERRKELIKNSIKFLRQNHFDGLDLDWEYPSFRDGGKPRDRDNYAQLVQELREEFDRESQKTGRPRLLITMAVPAGLEYIDKGYDIPKLNQYLDWMNILSYDYHSAFEPAVNHHSPLYSLTDSEDDEYDYDIDLNIDATIKHYLKAGADRDKLVLGIPTYGRSYTLFNPDANEIGAPADGPGDMGDATRENGYLAYYEICESIKMEGWTVIQPNPRAMGPYAHKGNQWVGYDDEQIVRRKAEYVAQMGLGGIMFWAIDNDDFRGVCHGKPYPLIEAAKEALISGATDNLVVTPTKTRSRTTTRSEETTKATAVRNSGGRQGVAEEDTTKASRGRKRIRTGSSKNTENVSTNKRRTGTRRRARPTTTTVATTLSTTTAPTARTTTPEPPTTPDPGSDFKCEDEGFFPHPRDCKKYFWCLSSGPSELGIIAHQFTCPSGLYFNKAADSCDYTQNVLCNKKIKKVTAATTSTTPTTTSATTTESPLSSIFTTRRPPPKITAATSKTTYIYTTSTTTEAPEYDDEYEYEDEEEEESFDSEEDPKVIKELIDLIKKVGGIEELERHLKLQEDGTATIKNDFTTPATISKSLYERVLGAKTEGTSNPIYSNLNRNLNSRGRPQYTTISRTRPQAEKLEEAEPEEETSQSAVRATSARPGGPEYVTIRRQRPSTSTEGTTELDYVTIRRQKTPQEETTTSKYTTIIRRRPSTEEPQNDETPEELIQTQTTEEQIESTSAIPEKESLAVAVQLPSIEGIISTPTPETTASTEKTTPQLFKPRPFVARPRPTKLIPQTTTTTEAPSTRKVSVRPVVGNRGNSRFKVQRTRPTSSPIDTEEYSSIDEEEQVNRAYRPTALADLSSLTSADIAFGNKDGTRKHIRRRPTTTTTTTEKPQPELRTGSRTIPNARKNLLASLDVSRNARRLTRPTTEKEDKLAPVVIRPFSTTTKATTPEFIELTSLKPIRSFSRTTARTVESSSFSIPIKVESIEESTEETETTELEDETTLLPNEETTLRLKDETTRQYTNIVRTKPTEKENDVTDTPVEDSTGSNTDTEYKITPPESTTEGQLVSRSRKIIKRIRPTTALPISDDEISESNYGLIKRIRPITKEDEEIKLSETNISDGTRIGINGVQENGKRRRKIIRKIRPGAFKEEEENVSVRTRLSPLESEQEDDDEETKIRIYRPKLNDEISEEVIRRPILPRGSFRPGTTKSDDTTTENLSIASRFRPIDVSDEDESITASVKGRYKFQTSELGIRPRFRPIDETTNEGKLVPRPRFLAGKSNENSDEKFRAIRIKQNQEGTPVDTPQNRTRKIIRLRLRPATTENNEEEGEITTSESNFITEPDTTVEEETEEVTDEITTTEEDITTTEEDITTTTTTTSKPRSTAPSLIGRPRPAYRPRGRTPTTPDTRITSPSPAVYRRKFNFRTTTSTTTPTTTTAETTISTTSTTSTTEATTTSTESVTTPLNTPEIALKEEIATTLQDKVEEVTTVLSSPDSETTAQEETTLQPSTEMVEETTQEEPSRPLFLRRPIQLRRQPTLNITKQALISTPTPSPALRPITRIPLRRIPSTTPKTELSSTATPQENVTQQTLRSRFRFATRKPYIRPSTTPSTTTVSSRPYDDQLLSNAGDIAVVFSSLATAPLPRGPKPSSTTPYSTTRISTTLAPQLSTSTQTVLVSRQPTRLESARLQQRFPSRQKGISQVYDLSTSSPTRGELKAIRVPPRVETLQQRPLTPQEFSRYQTTSQRPVSSTPSPGRGHLTFISRPQNVETASAKPFVPSELIRVTALPQGIISSTASPANVQLALISSGPGVLPPQGRPLTSQDYNRINNSPSTPSPTAQIAILSGPGVLSARRPQEFQRLTNSPGVSSTPSSAGVPIAIVSRGPRPQEFTRVSHGPSTPSPNSQIAFISGEPGRAINPQEFIKLSTPQRSERLTLISRPSQSPPEYDYYDAGVLSQLPPNSKVLVLPSGAVQCLDRGNFPHPGSCRKFISCYEGGVGEGVIGWEYTCPRGLSFDPVGGICNWSAGLGCKQIN